MINKDFIKNMITFFITVVRVADPVVNPAIKFTVQKREYRREFTNLC
jgi:hypothetical protein